MIRAGVFWESRDRIERKGGHFSSDVKRHATKHASKDKPADRQLQLDPLLFDPYESKEQESLSTAHFEGKDIIYEAEEKAFQGRGEYEGEGDLLAVTLDKPPKKNILWWTTSAFPDVGEVFRAHPFGGSGVRAR